MKERIPVEVVVEDNGYVISLFVTDEQLTKGSGPWRTLAYMGVKVPIVNGLWDIKKQLEMVVNTITGVYMLTMPKKRVVMQGMTKWITTSILDGPRRDEARVLLNESGAAVLDDLASKTIWTTQEGREVRIHQGRESARRVWIALRTEPSTTKRILEAEERSYFANGG